MDPASLIPIVDPIPIPGVWFDTLLVVTFVIHILFMNSVLGASFISLVELMRGKDTALPQRASRKLPTVLALTINFGVAPLLFLQVVYGQFDYVSSVLMGGWWLGIILVLLGAYYGLYVYDFRFPKLASGRAAILAMAIGCLLYVGFMFSNNMTLMLRPDQWVEYVRRGGAVLLNLDDPTFFPRWLHFMTAALAIGGLFLALMGKTGRAEDSERAISLGMAWFTRATMVNVLLGAWFLVSLPREVMLRFMGGSPVATAVLLLALAGAVGILFTGAKRMVWPATVLAVSTVSTMALARHLLRRYMLEPYFTPADLPVTNDWSSFAMFIGFLLLGAPLVWWMIRTFCISGACDTKTAGPSGHEGKA